jgi:FkbH-like protein
MRLPDDPQTLGPPCSRLNVLLVGECQVETLVPMGQRLGHSIKHTLFDIERRTDFRSLDLSKIDCIIWNLNFRRLISAALRIEIPSSDMLFARLDDNSEAERMFSECCNFLAHVMDRLKSELPNVPIFCLSPFEPSFSYIGNFVDDENFTSHGYFVRQLNLKLRSMTKNYSNFYYFDTNELLNYIGRAHLQDDVTGPGIHKAFIYDGDLELEKDRLQVSKLPSAIYNWKIAAGLYVTEFWRRIEAAMKTIKGDNRVKMIIVDLDDTLWRGVAADSELSGDETQWRFFGGWPLGFVESLLYFKKRGGLLAVCSKNEHDATIDRWRKIWRNAITPEDFTCVKINWDSKADNISEILRETNLLPDSVVFIDDNPREIDIVQQKFPTLRCLSRDHYDWRRIILREPEMMVDVLTEESQRRTAMTKALVARSDMKKGMSDEEWLNSLNVRQEIAFVRGANDPAFKRVFELLNKTNQFNTTGKRWELAEFERFVSANLCIATSLRDRTINNGIIGVAMVSKGELVQVVLSCRVFGLGAELALGAVAVREALAHSPIAIGRIVDTGKNFTCHNYYKQLGFLEKTEGLFEGNAAPPPPAWIELDESSREPQRKSG